MQKSASAPTIQGAPIQINGKTDAGKPRSLVKKHGQQSRSSPALSAAFSLREYATQNKHHIKHPDEVHKDPPPKDLPIEKIDLLGGNGRWRQVKAEEHFEKIRLEEKERKRQEYIKAQEKKRKQAELVERRRKQQQEEERRYLEEREQKLQEQQEKERKKREAEEKIRRQREEQEAERQRRMPKPCVTCNATGTCQDCGGKGHYFSVFLVPKIAPFDLEHRDREHGRKFQGCDTCGGHSHNLLGDLKKGSGNCPDCDGHGKIWPNIEELTSPKYRSNTGEVKLAPTV